MKVKILCLGRSAKEVEVPDGSTVEAAIEASGYPKNSDYTRQVNSHPAFDSDILQSGDILTLVPQVKGGN